MNDSPFDHERHDQLLIAAHAAGDLSGHEADGAAALVRDCPGCAALESDLRALATAVHVLPSPARPRDFTLSPADAARLRRGGWRRVRDLVRGDGFRLARPVGAGLASLGFAGLVFASTIGAGAPVAPALSPAGAGIVEASAAASDLAGAGDGGSSRAAGADPSADTFDAQQHVTARELEADPDADEASGAAAGQTAAAAQPNEAIIVVSGSLFIVGIGLFGARWTADRLGDG